MCEEGVCGVESLGLVVFVGMYFLAFFFDELFCLVCVDKKKSS